MANKWIEGRRGAVTPFLAVAVLVIVSGLFQVIFIGCRGEIAQCEPFNISYIFPVNTSNPIKDNVVTGEDQDKIIKNRKVIAERYNGRIAWVFLMSTTVLFYVASLFAFGRLIYKSSSFRHETASTRTTISIVLAFSFGILQWLFPDSYAPFIRRVIEVTIAQGQIGMPVIFETLNLINALSSIATFSLVVASCAVLIPRETVVKTDTSDEDVVPKEADQMANGAPAEIDTRFAVVSEQMKDLQVVLYIGAFLLILSVLRFNVVTQWSLAFISPDAIEAAKSFYLSLSSVVATFFSLILAAAYLPAAYILLRRAQLLAGELPLPPNKQEEMLKSKGLTFSLGESLPRVLAIFGPLLAGPIGELFKILLT